jgi:hypothetical protein
MLRNLSVILALSVVVTACGGSSSGGKKSSSSSSDSSVSSSVVSTPASSLASSSSSSESSVSSSESSASSSVCPVADDIELDVTKLEPNYGHTLTVTPSNDGTLVNYVKGNESAIIKLTGTPINKALIEMSVVIDEDFIASGGSLQVFAQSTEDYGVYDFKGPNASELKANEVIVLSNQLDDKPAFDTDSLQIGLQATGAVEADVKGIVTIKSIVIRPAAPDCNTEEEETSSSSSESSSSTPATPALFSYDFSKGISGWAGNSNITLAQAGSTMTITPNTGWTGDNWRFAAALTLTTPIASAAGKTLEMVVSVPAEYATNGLELQFSYKHAEGQYSGNDYGNNVALTNLADGKYVLTEVIPEKVTTDLTAIGVQPGTIKDYGSVGPIVVHSVVIK